MNMNIDALTFLSMYNTFTERNVKWGYLCCFNLPINRPFSTHVSDREINKLLKLFTLSLVTSSLSENNGKKITHFRFDQCMHFAR